MKIEKELLREFRSLIKKDDYDALEYWSEKVNPHVHNMEFVKKSILLSLASMDDKQGDRGRIHVLLEGKPGTGKSLFRTWLHNKLGAVMTDEGSEVGLKGDASGDEITRGALPRADGDMITIDELDDFKKKERKALLTSMEEGIISIEKGGKSKTFSAEARVVACCNRTDRFSTELKDRFDFHFRLDRLEEGETKEVMDDKIDNWRDKKEGYDGERLKKYLQFVEEYQTPYIPQMTKNKIKTLMRAYITCVDGNTDDVEINKRITLCLPTKRGIRQYERLLRITHTIAKLNCRNVKSNDFLRAIEMINPKAVEDVLDVIEKKTDLSVSAVEQ